MVECPLMVQWVIRSIPDGGPFQLFLVPASALQLVQQRPLYVASCLWDGHIKDPLLLIKKVVHDVAAAGFFSLTI